MLSTTTEAATRAAHDLDEVIRRLTLLNLFHEDAGITQSIRDSNLQDQPVDVNISGLDTLKSTHILKLELRQRFLRENFVGSPQCSFHNATRGPEDDSRTSRFAQRFVKIFIREVCKVDARFADHLRRLASRQDTIDVFERLFVLEAHLLLPVMESRLHLRPFLLKFLGSAWHHGHDDDLPRIDPHLLSPVRFRHRTKHLLRRLAGRNVVQHLWEERLYEFDPAR